MKNFFQEFDEFKSDIRGEKTALMAFEDSGVEIFVQNANKYSYDVYISELEKNAQDSVGERYPILHTKNDISNYLLYVSLTCDIIHQNICDVYTGSDYVEKSDDKIYTLKFISKTRYDKEDPHGYVPEDSSNTRFDDHMDSVTTDFHSIILSFKILESNK